MKIPSKLECLDLFDKYLVPQNVRRHCKKVSIVGTKLADELKNKGVDVDVPLVEIGCLLHDMMKIYALDSLVPRPESGYFGPTVEEKKLWDHLSKEFADENGDRLHETLILSKILEQEYPEFSEFVSKIGSTGNPTYLQGSIELKIIHYVDWRIDKDYIVDLQKRLDYLGVRYRDSWQKKGRDVTWWENMVKLEKDLETELFRYLDFSPEDLGKNSVRRYNIQESSEEHLKLIISEVVDVLENGGVIIYPAKNGYMIGANPFDAGALEKIYASKRRPFTQYLACIVTDSTMAEKYAQLSENESFIACNVMPSPLLLVTSSRYKAPEQLGHGEFAFTVARTPLTRSLINAYDKPVVATSCNISGKKVSLCFNDVDTNIHNYVDIFLDFGKLPSQPDYTVLDLRQELLLKRIGLIDRPDIEYVLNSPDKNTIKSVLLLRTRIKYLEELINFACQYNFVKSIWLRKQDINYLPHLDLVIVVTDEVTRDYIDTEITENISRMDISKTEVVLAENGINISSSSGLKINIQYRDNRETVHVTLRNNHRLLWSE